MNAAHVIAEAEAAGVRLEVVDDKLRWQGRASPGLLDRLRAHKAEVVAVLTDQWRDDPAESTTGLWSDDDSIPLAEAWPYGFAPELPDDDEQNVWLRGGRDDAAHEAMRRDLAVVVQDPRGWAEAGAGARAVRVVVDRA